jgi:hypothetical protein
MAEHHLADAGLDLHKDVDFAAFIGSIERALDRHVPRQLMDAPAPRMTSGRSLAFEMYCARVFYPECHVSTAV